MIKEAIAALATMTAFPSLIFAQKNPLEWHGFFSEVVSVADSDLSYGPGITVRPDFTRESRLGLNLSAKLNPKFSIASQFLAKGNESDGRVTADWAFVTYYPIESLSIHLGKQKLPAWLISNYADVGHAYPWVRPPVEVYSINPIKAYSGISANYVLNLGSQELQIEANAGNQRLKEKLQGLGSSTAEGGLETDFQFAHMVGGNATFVSEYLTLRAGLVQGEVSIATDFFRIHDARGQFMSTGFKSEIGKLVAYGEFAKIKGKVSSADRDAAVTAAAAANSKAIQTQDPADIEIARKASSQAEVHTKSILDLQAYYTTLGYSLTDFLPYVTYANVIRPDNAIGVGEQSSVTAGLRYDIDINAAIKAELHHVMIPEDSWGLINYDPEQQSPDQLDHEFHIISVSTDFVF